MRKIPLNTKPKKKPTPPRMSTAERQALMATSASDKTKVSAKPVLKDKEMARQSEIKKTQAELAKLKQEKARQEAVKARARASQSGSTARYGKVKK